VYSLTLEAFDGAMVSQE